jgi:hypothetical protein
MKTKRTWNYYFWNFVHNAIVHPMLALPMEEPKWLTRFHDWTAEMGHL